MASHPIFSRFGDVILGRPPHEARGFQLYARCRGRCCYVRAGVQEGREHLGRSRSVGCPILQPRMVRSVIITFRDRFIRTPHLRAPRILLLPCAVCRKLRSGARLARSVHCTPHDTRRSISAALRSYTSVL